MAMVMFPPTANQLLRKPGKQKEGGCIILTQDTLDYIETLRAQVTTISGLHPPLRALMRD